MAAFAAFLLLLTINTDCISSVLAQSLPSPWNTGIATNYGGPHDGMDPNSPSFGTKDGSCSYGILNPDTYPYWTVAALSPANQFAMAGPSEGCGQCFEIQCLNSGGEFAGRCSSSQSIIVTITDTCPECGANHIDIQALTFNKISPMEAGRIDIQYRRVDCTPPQPVSIAIDNNVGTGGWLRLVVEKTAGFGGITAVAIRGAGASWEDMDNKYGSAWELSNAPELPWDFQFTSDDGQTIAANHLVNQNGLIGKIPTEVQFSLSGSSGSNDISYKPGNSAAGSSDSASANGQGPPSSQPSSPPLPTSIPPPALGIPPTPTGQSPPPPPPGSSFSPENGFVPPSAPGLPPPALSVPPPASGTPPSAGSCPCADVAPPGGLTCAQQQGYGKCEEPWMASGNFCQLTCGHCPAACSAGGPPISNQAAIPPPPPDIGNGPPPLAGSTPSLQDDTRVPANPPPASPLEPTSGTGDVNSAYLH